VLPTVSDLSAPIVLLGSLPELEPDCACPVPPQVVSQTPVGDVQWEVSPELYHMPLINGWELYCNPLAGGAPAVLNQRAVQQLNTFAHPRALTDNVDHQLAAAQLIVREGDHACVPFHTSPVLTAWIHVTNACNLDCPYCYIRKSAEHMRLETGIKAIDALIATAQQRHFSEIKLKYAGGEAALHYRLVQKLHAYAAQRTQEHGLTQRAVVLSNGTVMPEAFADWLAETGVRLMLSVDGVGDDHDVQRPWKNGAGGAFAALERNLTERLLPRGICPDICITVTGHTAQTAHTAVEWAIRNDLPFSLNFYRENEQSASHHQLRYEEQQLIDGLLQAYAVVERELPTRPLLDGLLDRVQASAHSHTCGVGQNYVVITHTGKVAQCQMALQQAQPFAADADLIQMVAAGPIHNVSVDEKAGCQDCTWRYRCAGGCPLITLRATGRTDIKSPNCAIYQTLMPAALRLEGLRILKMAGAYQT